MSTGQHHNTTQTSRTDLHVKNESSPLTCSAMLGSQFPAHRLISMIFATFSPLTPATRTLSAIFICLSLIHESSSTQQVNLKCEQPQATGNQYQEIAHSWRQIGLKFSGTLKPTALLYGGPLLFLSCLGSFLGFLVVMVGVVKAQN